jgi:hypothetical protein
MIAAKKIGSQALCDAAATVLAAALQPRIGL